MSARPTSLFITVGSTLFPSLTNTILSPESLDVLALLGITKLEVQYGKADFSASITAESSSKGDLKPPLASATTLAGANDGNHDWVHTTRDDQMEVSVFRYTDDFEGAVRRSGAVISHAGKCCFSQTSPR